jgi:hypothetical protein
MGKVNRLECYDASCGKGKSFAALRQMNRNATASAEHA